MNKNQISKYVLENLKNGKIQKEVAIELVNKINEKEDIAIIGMSCRYDNTDDYEEFWNTIVNQESTIRRCTKERVELFCESIPRIAWNKVEKYSKGAYFQNVDQFDNEFYEYPKEKADVLFPGTRVLLELAYRTLEDAGYLGEQLNENKTGVFIGNNFTKDTIFSYLNHCSQQMMKGKGGDLFDVMLHNWTSGMATRVASFYDLKGPAYCVDASCPSSTVAIVNACNAIKQKQCSTALVGGILFDMVPLKMYGGGWIFIHDDKMVTKLFDDDSLGAYNAEGAAMIMLKPYQKAVEDGDHIYGVISGISHNNGGRNGDYIQSSSEDIKRAVIDAVKDARINAADLSMLIGEGYPQKVEEGIELRGLIDGLQSFTPKKQYCGLIGYTANIGYLVSAIGVFNMVTIMLAMKHKTIPALCQFNYPTSMLSLANSPFYVNDINQEWKTEDGKPRLAASYSFGFGGTNIVLILHDVQEKKREDSQPIEKEQLFILSAKTKYSFKRYIEDYINFLQDSPDLNLLDICYTASTARIVFDEYRLAIVASSLSELLNKLKKFTSYTGKIEGVYYKEQLTNKKHKRIYNQADGKSIQEIANEFCNGKNFLLKKTFLDMNARRCKLPRYSFDKKSCWMKTK